MKRSLSPRAAFTLLEIMLVVSIIMLLLGAAIMKMRPALGFGKRARVEGDIQSYSTGLMTYESFNGFLPSNEQGLNALAVQPTTDPKPRHWTQFMTAVPMDPWGHAYVYEKPGKHNTKGFDLYSCGADGMPGTEDDIGNWEDK